MKTSNVIILVFIALFLGVVGYRLYEKAVEKIPEGMVLVPKTRADSLNFYIQYADSLKRIADLPADTVVLLDTVYLEVTKEVESEPHQIPLAQGIFQVTDTLNVEGDINAWVTFKVRGFLQSKIEWGYNPVFREKETIITKNVPYPVIQYIDSPVPVKGNYVSLAASGNDKMFIFGIDYDHVTPKYVYGLQYRRMGEANIFGLKAGLNLNTLFKK